MKLSLLLILSLGVALAQKPGVREQESKPTADSKTSLDNPERLAFFEIGANFQVLQQKAQEVQAKINDSALGKEFAEIQKQMTELQKQYADLQTAAIEKHKAKGCILNQVLAWDKCPEPAKKP